MEQAAKTALSVTRNNYLSHPEKLKLEKARKQLQECEQNPGSCSDSDIASLNNRIEAYEQLDADRDVKLIETCSTGSKLECIRLTNDLRAALKSYNEDPQAKYNSKEEYLKAIGGMYPALAAEYEGSMALLDLNYQIIDSRANGTLGEQLRGYDVGAAAGAAGSGAAATAVGGRLLTLGSGLSTVGRSLWQSGLSLASDIATFAKNPVTFTLTNPLKTQMGALFTAETTACITSGICPPTSLGDELTITFRNLKNLAARSIGKGKNSWYVSPAKANAGFSKPPYDPTKPIFDFSSDGKTTYVRVYAPGTDSKYGGRWMMKADDIQGLTPTQIKDIFDLPELPTHVVDVTPPKGIKIRTGTVNKGNYDGQGGGTQFQIRKKNDIDKVTFKNPRPLPKP